MRKFRIDPAEAELLVHDAILAFLATDVEIRNPKAWLVGAVCNGCRVYWRHRVKVDRIEGVPLVDANHLVDEHAVHRIESTLMVQTVLARLSERDRELLRLHYFERLTAGEIAPVLGTTERYVAKRISVVLRRARKAILAAAAPKGLLGEGADRGGGRTTRFDATAVCAKPV